MNDAIENWILSLREEDKENVRNFLEVTVEYLNKHAEYLKGSGFYLVGSALSKKWAYFKGDYYGERRKLEDELHERVKEKFGIEKLKAHAEAYGRFGKIPESDEIDRMYDEGNAAIRKKLFSRENYGDIDLIITGLTMEKADSKKEIWQNYAALLKEKFPDAKHPDEFTYWDTYDMDTGTNKWVVDDYILEMPTKIHFMLYRSDERFGSDYNKEREFGFLDHWPVNDVTVYQWKELQENDKLPFLSIVEY